VIGNISRSVDLTPLLINREIPTRISIIITVGIINDAVINPVQNGNAVSGGVGKAIKFNPLFNPNKRIRDPNKILIIVVSFSFISFLI
jgi:hypothetical protein